MYNAEVLSKFPVVQHFPFGSLFSWERDPQAMPPPTSTHVASQPPGHPSSGMQSGSAAVRAIGQASTKAPWASQESASRFARLGTTGVSPSSLSNVRGARMGLDIGQAPEVREKSNRTHSSTEMSPIQAGSHIPAPPKNSTNTNKDC